MTEFESDKRRKLISLNLALRSTRMVFRCKDRSVELENRRKSFRMTLYAIVRPFVCLSLSLSVLANIRVPIW